MLSKEDNSANNDYELCFRPSAVSLTSQELQEVAKIAKNRTIFANNMFDFTYSFKNFF